MPRPTVARSTTWLRTYIEAHCKAADQFIETARTFETIEPSRAQTSRFYAAELLTNAAVAQQILNARSDA